MPREKSAETSFGGHWKDSSGAAVARPGGTVDETAPTESRRPEAQTRSAAVPRLGQPDATAPTLAV
jgi:hypothetical protein